jgi:PHD/YefM family antitoxin component YafN of YafNO toxin-antitoxin module
MSENATTETPSPIIVGKSNGNDMLETATLLLPNSFEWLVVFEPVDIARFLTELMNALQEATTQNNLEPILEVIEAWEETAELLSDPEHVAAVAEVRAEYWAGKGRSIEDYLAKRK